MIPNKKVFRPDEVAEILALNIGTIYRFIYYGLLVPADSGARPVRIAREELIRIMQLKELGISPDSHGAKLWRPAEAAKHLNKSPSTVSRWYSEGQLLGVKIGRTTLRIFEVGIERLQAHLTK